jgi:hypothetical protein
MGPPLHMHVIRPPTHHVVHKGVMEQQGSLMVREEGKIGSTGQSMSPIPPINEIMHKYILIQVDIRATHLFQMAQNSFLAILAIYYF